jgi:hypothetical protein
MKADAEIRAGLGVLLAIQLIATFGVMGLLVRMNPAIDAVVHDDLPTLAATQDMAVVLAEESCRATPEVSRFVVALDRAEAVSADPTEQARLAQIREAQTAAFSGDCDARTSVIGNIVELADANRTEMLRASTSARQLAIAGGWATALVGLLAFVVSLLLLRGWLRRFADPLRELEAVLQANASGDPYRRNRRMEGPNELGVIAARVNHLLDRKLARDEAVDPALRNVDRSLLLHLLDKLGEPVIVVDSSGAMLVANRPALDRMAADKSFRVAETLRVGPDGPDTDISMVMGVEPFGPNLGYLVTLRPIVTPTDGAPPPSLLDDEVVIPTTASLEGSHTADLPPDRTRGPRRVPDEWK